MYTDKLQQALDKYFTKQKGEYAQAPIISEQGDTTGKIPGKTIRTHELETILMQELGPKDMAMLFFTGHAKGFAVAEETITSRCNLSH